MKQHVHNIIVKFNNVEKITDIENIKKIVDESTDKLLKQKQCEHNECTIYNIETRILEDIQPDQKGKKYVIEFTIYTTLYQDEHIAEEIVYTLIDKTGLTLSEAGKKELKTKPEVVYSVFFPTNIMTKRTPEGTPTYELKLNAQPLAI